MKTLLTFGFLILSVTAFSQSVLTLGPGTSMGVINNADLCANVYSGTEFIYGGGTLCSQVIGIEPDPGSSVLPAEYKMSQNYPNPFNPETNVKYQLPERAFVSIKLYDVVGREITLLNAEQAAGYYNLKISASELSSGIYFLSLNAGNFSKVIKLSVIK
jgi:hypothetical protein